MAVLSVVESLRIQLDVGIGHGALTEFHPWTGVEDALAVHLHPCLQVIENLCFLLIVGTIATKGNIQQQTAVLAYDVHELFHHRCCRLIGAPFINGRVVMPPTDAIARLPRLFNNLIGSPALHVPCQCLALTFVENLSENHGSRIGVVEMGGDLHARVADVIEGQHRHVEVDQIRLVAVDGIQRTVVEISHKCLCGFCGPMCPVPLLVNLAVAPRAVAQRMVLGIEFLWVISFPPLAFAVLFRQMSVVIDACLLSVLVIALRRFIPRPGMISMERDT